MSKAKLAAAQELLREKEFDAARAVLETIPYDETAQKWLQKLPKATKPPTKRRGIRAIIPLLLFIVGLVIGTMIGGTPARPQVASAPTRTPAATITPGPSPSPIPSATITQTPMPTDTPIPTNTVPPPSTPAPESGTRGNPYPISNAGAVRDGRFQVNFLQRGMTAQIKEMNQFNPDPEAGEEWMLVNVTFYCDLPSDQTCNVSLMRIELVGNIGEVYEQDFAVIDDQFEGEVFGGGQTSGAVGFIAKSNDANLLIAVNDLGDRIFFTAG